MSGLLAAAFSDPRDLPNLGALGLFGCYQIIFSCRNWQLRTTSLLVIYAILDGVIQPQLSKRRIDATHRASKARKWMNTGECKELEEFEEYAVSFVGGVLTEDALTQRGGLTSFRVGKCRG